MKTTNKYLIELSEEEAQLFCDAIGPTNQYTWEGLRCSKQHGTYHEMNQVIYRLFSLLNNAVNNCKGGSQPYSVEERKEE